MSERLQSEHGLSRRAFVGSMAWVLGLGALSGCGGSRSAGSGAGGDVLRLAQTAEPTTLDPAQVQDGPTIELMMQLYDGLIQWTPENELAPALAESWNVEDGGRTYVFHLRKDAKFHNGRLLTAEDVVYSITRSLDPKIASPVAMVYLNDIVGAAEYRAGKAQTVSGVEAVDSHTVRIRIDQPKAYFLAKLTYPTAYAVCREAIESTGGVVNEKSMLGTGPFVLKEYRRGDRLILAANPDYFGGAPKLPRLERRILRDQGARRDKFEAGELDIADISMAMYRADSRNPELKDQIKLFDRPAVFYIALNQKAYAPFRDRRVRQAFAHAVNRDEIVERIHHGLPRVARGILPYGIPGYDPDFRGLEFNPDKAKQLLAEAGYPNGQGLPPLTLSFRAGVEDIRNTAVAVQAELARHLGMQVTLDEVEWTTFLTRRNAGSMPAYFLRWAADYLDPQNFLSTMLHSQAPENTLGYSNPEFDRLCDQADVMQEQEQRLATYRQAEEIAIADAPWIPIYFQKDVELWNPRLRGVDDCVMGHLPYKNVEFAESGV